MTTNQYIQVDSSVLNTTEHCTGHIYLYTKYNGINHFIIGHNKEHNNGASLGGFKKLFNHLKIQETLLETICREFSEETLDCLFSKDKTNDLINYLTKGIFTTRKSEKGQHYVVFCDATNMVFDMEKINIEFKQKLNDPNLTPDQQENDYLTMVSFDNIKTALHNNESNKSSDNIIVKDHANVDIKIRNVCIPAFKWILTSKSEI